MVVLQKQLEIQTDSLINKDIYIVVILRNNFLIYDNDSDTGDKKVNHKLVSENNVEVGQKGVIET